MGTNVKCQNLIRIDNVRVISPSFQMSRQNNMELISTSRLTAVTAFPMSKYRGVVVITPSLYPGDSGFNCRLAGLISELKLLVMFYKLSRQLPRQYPRTGHDVYTFSSVFFAIHYSKQVHLDHSNVFKLQSLKVSSNKCIPKIHKI